MRFELVDPNLATSELVGWSLARHGKAISKTFIFEDFSRALGFMTCAGVYADKIDHHPEWSNVYNRIEVLLTTHDVDAVTTLDIMLARFMDNVA